MKNPIFNKLNTLFKKHLPLKKLKKSRIWKLNMEWFLQQV
jgi:hypothetical protein